jgi:hypothetical protein
VCAWQTPVCTADEKGKHHWFIQIRKGTYHQIGISQGASKWNGHNPVSHHSGAHLPFAFLYSHHDGWNRYRGAATPAKFLNNGHCNRNVCWSGTWDQWQKGSEFQVDLNCDTNQFTVTTHTGEVLATMVYPKSWNNGNIYPAVAGQSHDHRVTIYAEKQFRLPPKNLETFQWDPAKDPHPPADNSCHLHHPDASPLAPPRCRGRSPTAGRPGCSSTAGPAWSPPRASVRMAAKPSTLGR